MLSLHIKWLGHSLILVAGKYNHFDNMDSLARSRKLWFKIFNVLENIFVEMSRFLK